MLLPDFVDNETLEEYNLLDNCDKENIIKFINDSFGSRWKQSYPYELGKEIEMKTKPLPEKLKNNNLFIQFTYYAHELSQSILNNNFDELEEKLRKELISAEENGGLCIYISTVLYCLLLENKLAYTKDLGFIQGYYKHELREDFPSIIPFGKNHLGLHSFLTFKGSIIDMSIVSQEEMFFDFKGEFCLLGNVPEGLDLVGFKERHNIVMEYAEEYASKSGLNYNQWVKYHTLNSKLVILTAQKRLLEEKHKELSEL